MPNGKSALQSEFRLTYLSICQSVNLPVCQSVCTDVYCEKMPPEIHMMHDADQSHTQAVLYPPPPEVGWYR
jgi:hypothetical protein